MLKFYYAYAIYFIYNRIVSAALFFLIIRTENIILLVIYGYIHSYCQYFFYTAVSMRFFADWGQFCLKVQHSTSIYLHDCVNYSGYPLILHGFLCNECRQFAYVNTQLFQNIRWFGKRVQGQYGYQPEVGNHLEAEQHIRPYCVGNYRCQIHHNFIQCGYRLCGRICQRYSLHLLEVGFLKLQTTPQKPTKILIIIH
ncbi:hypothetical protein SS50377_28102 [Spironucleus salmonicida]|uniref:Uncharacterized protein n=1 Tax=Spironucleus salmonicida TaxID=348837 RepID=A0A9P8RV56_9EUKA|nr:hypothetical protein SS50377_28102 [Spironucleus salmonicida]